MGANDDDSDISGSAAGGPNTGVVGEGSARENKGMVEESGVDCDNASLTADDISGTVAGAPSPDGAVKSVCSSSAELGVGPELPAIAGGGVNPTPPATMGEEERREKKTRDRWIDR